MDAYWNSSFNSQLHLHQFSSNLSPTLLLLQEAANTVLGRAATQRAPDRLGKWNNGNLLRFNKGKCKNLHLEGQDKPGPMRMASSSVKMSLGAAKPPRSPGNTQAVAFTDYLGLPRSTQSPHIPSCQASGLTRPGI